MAEKGIMVGRPSSEWLPPILEKLTAEERKVLDKWKGIKEMIIYGFPFDPQPIVKEPRWKVDEPFAIKVAPIGAYMMKSMNPNLEYSPEWIRDQMMGSLDAGACAIHVHVRNPDGSPTLDPVYYHKVIDPIKAKYGKNVLVDGCPEGGTTFEESMAPLIDFKGIAETAPITLAAIFWSNTAMCVTKDAVQSHVDFMQGINQKPELVVHDCGSIDQARDWLIDSGVYKYRPVLWRICVGEPHLTTFHNPVAMLEVYNYLIRRIQDVEPNSVVEVSQ